MSSRMIKSAMTLTAANLKKCAVRPSFWRRAMAANSIAAQRLADHLRLEKAEARAFMTAYANLMACAGPGELTVVIQRNSKRNGAN
jgi:hypothetical protein